MGSDDVTITAVYGPKSKPLPLAGNTISTYQLDVKIENDDQEIQELAAKMIETEKANLARQQQNAARMQGRGISGRNAQPLIANGQANTSTNYQNNPCAKTRPPTNDSTNSKGKKKPCDEESQKRHFGWMTFDKTYIPYIYRQTEKYCAVRIVEYKILRKYLNCLHPDIYNSCTCVRSYYITDAESQLFNEINRHHCNGEFGWDLFTMNDLVVRLSDATKFYQFLDICHQKLISGGGSISEKCGFILINKESVVSYTMSNNQQVVPLFYFEGNTDVLKLKADYVTGWSLAYLKFCCKVQNIRKDLFSSESLAVISLTDIKRNFPNGTEFEDFWPSKVVNSNLLLEPQSCSDANNFNWSRRPIGPPPTIFPLAVTGNCPNGTEFKDYWPSKVGDSNMLLEPQSSSDANNFNWSSRPIGPQPTINPLAVKTQQRSQQQPQRQQQHANNSVNFTRHPLGPPPNIILPAVNTKQRSQQQQQPEQLQQQWQPEQQHQQQQQQQQLQSKQTADYPASKERPQRSLDANNSVNFTRHPLGPPPNKIPPAVNIKQRSQQQQKRQQQQQQQPEQHQQQRQPEHQHQEKQQLQSKQTAAKPGAVFSQMADFPAIKAQWRQTEQQQQQLQSIQTGAMPGAVYSQMGDYPAIKAQNRQTEQHEQQQPKQQQRQPEQQQQQRQPKQQLHQEQPQQTGAKRGTVYSQMADYPAIKAQRQHANFFVAATQAQNGALMQQSQNNISMMHAQMFATPAQPHNRSNNLVPNHCLMLSNRQPYTFNNETVSMHPVNDQRNTPLPSVRAGQNSTLQTAGTYIQQHHMYAQLQQNQFSSVRPPSVYNSSSVSTSNGTSIAVYPPTPLLSIPFTRVCYTGDNP